MTNTPSYCPIAVCAREGGPADRATALSKRLDVPLVSEPGEGLTLLWEAEGLSLCGFGLSFRGDFEPILRRVTGGRLPHEMLAHLAKTREPHPTAIDATAGMGEDSFLLAACGYEVTLYEQNPVIAALLRDALDRAGRHPALSDIAARMHLIEGDSIAGMREGTASPDLIYLDPMFPARQKSGLINKKLQLIQKLEHPCVEEEALLSAAIGLEPGKIIIKRPLKGAVLAGKTPHYTVRGKAIRYDCFAFPKKDR